MKLNQIIQGDCVDVMKEMSDNSIDLVLTSPAGYLKPFASSIISVKFTESNTAALSLVILTITVKSRGFDAAPWGVFETT